MSIIDGHTCIGDDGGTPNRRCDACETEKSTAALWPVGTLLKKTGIIKIDGRWAPNVNPLEEMVKTMKIGSKIKMNIPISETHDLRVTATVTSKRRVKR